MTSLRIGLFCLIAGCAQAQSDLLYSLQAPEQALVPGREATLHLLVLNVGEASAPVELPPTVSLTLRDSTGQQWQVPGRVAARPDRSLAAGRFVRVPLVLLVPTEARRELVAEVAIPYAARTVLSVRPPPRPVDDEAPAPSLTVTEPSAVPGREPEAPALADTQFLDHFGVHEPVYFVYGRETPAAKFQFSFKYRLFGLADDLIPMLPALRQIHFGYTQRSLWHIDGESGPFYDTSYIPELFYESAYFVSHSGGGVHWLGFQAGIRHESNGRAGEDSRSLNMAYLRPTVALGNLEGWRLLISPTVFTYITTLHDNPDLRDYRGFLDLRLAFGRARSWELAVSTRMGSDFQNVGLQADLTVPVTVEQVGFSAYFMVQYFNGYGESFLRYRDRTSSWRAGVSFVR